MFTSSYNKYHNCNIKLTQVIPYYHKDDLSLFLLVKIFFINLIVGDNNLSLLGMSLITISWSCNCVHNVTQEGWSSSSIIRTLDPLILDFLIHYVTTQTLYLFLFDGYSPPAPKYTTPTLLHDQTTVCLSSIASFIVYCDLS